MIYDIKNMDWFFISYDETNADSRFDKLTNAGFNIKRVKGIKGFHSALYNCAIQSQTPRFGTIDGDNDVDLNFFTNLSIDENINDDDLVYSYSSKNSVNGLIYGNGGMKIWPTNLILHKPTHEASLIPTIDFCSVYRYMQIDEIGSEVIFDSHYHAFRSGYREAVKLSYVGDFRVDFPTFLKTAYAPNISRLNVWMGIGIDHPMGEWTMYGARVGFSDFWLNNVDVTTIINDYNIFADEYIKKAYKNNIQNSTNLLERINTTLDIKILQLDIEQSIWFKNIYVNPPRTGLMNPNMKKVTLNV